MPGRRSHIALLVDASRAYGRGLLNGVAAFADERNDWLLLPHERNILSELPSWIRQNRVDGIIAEIPTAAFGGQLLKMKVPVVDVQGHGKCPQAVSFDSDASQIGRMAAEFFLDAGFAHVAYCGYPGIFFSDERQAAFVGCLQKRRIDAHVYAWKEKPEESGDFLHLERSGMEYEPSLRRWLAELPKPVAILACNDVRGQQIVNACREQGVELPAQAAVMGMDNDEVICCLCRPKLTSIAPDTRKIGYLAAQAVARMLAGEGIPFRRNTIPPLRIVERESTDTIPATHPVVVKAGRMIRDRVCRGLSVGQIASELDYSRSMLDKLFRQQFGHSLSREMLRVRLSRSTALLRDSDLPVAEIAVRCGFPTATSFCRFFNRETGQSPAVFRAQVRKSLRT